MKLVRPCGPLKPWFDEMEQRYGSVDAYIRDGLGKGPAKSARLDANDGILGGIEVAASAEDLRRDRVAFELVGPSGERFLHDEREEVPHPLRGLEFPAGEDPIELPTDGSVG